MVLRLSIDGYWEPQDFVTTLECLESLYYKSAPISRRLMYRSYWDLKDNPALSTSYDFELDRLNDRLREEYRRRLAGAERICVHQIQYSSPGKIDLIGIGEAFQSVEGIVDRLIKFFTERRLRRYEDQNKRIEVATAEENLKTLQIENAERLLRLYREYGEFDTELLIPLAVRDQEMLCKQISEGKITGIERKPSKT